MAAFRPHMTLRQASSLIHNAIIRDSKALTISNPQFNFVRGRVKPKPWWMKRRADGARYAMQELTKDNQDFLQEVAFDEYKEKLKSPLKDAPWPRHEYNPKKTIRTGLLGIKIGVVPHWTAEGNKIFVTILQILDNHVIRYTPPEEFTKSPAYNSKWTGSYGSLVVGALSCDPYFFSKAYVNLFRECGLPPKRKLTRFLVTPDAAIQPGTPLHAMHYKVGDVVDCQGRTISHGFQGVVKRHGFKGGPKSHGATKWHRRVGTISSGRTLKRILKGQKMPGLMGEKLRTLRGLEVMRINTKYNLLFVKGPCIPGPNHGYVRILDTKLPLRRMVREPAVAMPTWFPEDEDKELPEDIYNPKLYQFGEPTIIFKETDTKVAKKKTRSKK